MQVCQVKGSKTWYLYSNDALPLARAMAFDNAPIEDFSQREVSGLVC